VRPGSVLESSPRTISDRVAAIIKDPTYLADNISRSRLSQSEAFRQPEIAIALRVGGFAPTLAKRTRMGQPLSGGEDMCGPAPVQSNNGARARKKRDVFMVVGRMVPLGVVRRSSEGCERIRDVNLVVNLSGEKFTLRSRIYTQKMHFPARSMKTNSLFSRYPCKGNYPLTSSRTDGILFLP
jgi:hypothetical protein